MPSHSWFSGRICVFWVADTVVDNNVLEIERAQPRQAGDIDAELIGIGSPLMVRINPAFRAKEVFCGPCIECVHRQRVGACQISTPPRSADTATAPRMRQ